MRAVHELSKDDTLPGFTESLRLLVQRERYSFHDIGLMFGVSRERVRQWCEARNISHPDEMGQRGMMCVRLWNAELSCFEPRSRGWWTKEQKRRRADRQRRAMEEIRRQRRERLVATVKGLKAKLGRDPLMREIWEVIDGRRVPKQGITSRILYEFDSVTRSSKIRLRAFRVATGTAANGRGRPKGSGLLRRVEPATTRVHHERVNLWKAEGAA